MSSEGSENKPSKLARIIAIILGVAMAAGAAYLMYLGITLNNFLYIIMGFLLFSFVTTLFNVGVRPIPPLMKPVNTMTVIKCDKCGFSEIREFRKGDYIFKEIGKCKDCDGIAYIKSIYTIEEQKSKSF